MLLVAALHLALVHEACPTSGLDAQHSGKSRFAETRHLVVTFTSAASPAALTPNWLSVAAVRAGHRTRDRAQIDRFPKSLDPMMEKSARARSGRFSHWKKRRPAELRSREIDSQLLFAGKMNRNERIAKDIQKLEVTLDRDEAGRVLVDLKADVSNELLADIQTRGALC